MLLKPESSEVHYSDDIFAYAFGGPVTDGTIKTGPEMFRVKEELDFELTGTGEHVYLKIQKRNANTSWVAAQLARHAGIRAMDVGFAGRKDRYALTEQWFSCYLPGDDTVSFNDCRPEGTRILERTRHSKKLRKGDVRKNRFDLTVLLSSLPQQETLEKRLVAIREQGFPNYFGEQRFGRRGENLAAADSMLRIGERIHKRRDVYLSAARAWLFNLYLSDRVQADDWRTGTGPLYGKSRDPQPGENNLDQISQSWIAGLRRLGLKAGTRERNVKPDSLTWEFGPDRLSLRFSLPGGSFATSLLRELFVIQDASLGRKVLNHAQ